MMHSFGAKYDPEATKEPQCPNFLSVPAWLPKVQTAQKQKSRITKSLLVQDWVLNLINIK